MHADDPFADLSPIRRLTLRLRLRRARRKGMAERHALTLGALSGVIGSDLVVAALASRRGPAAVTEIAFASGVEIRLSSCYRPAIAILAGWSADGVVVLEHAAYHGNRWGLYFTAGPERLPLLANEVSIVGGPSGPGGDGPTATPRAPHAELLAV
ncbi:MAG: hypothetical protein M3Y36_06110 [Actinomycetota bacterium]|nr:hypothetical protein [Actinomycetota bacterium]